MLNVVEWAIVYVLAFVGVLTLVLFWIILLVARSLEREGNELE